MTVYLASAVHSPRLAQDDLPAIARALAGDRKVFRMLDPLSMAPFVAALEAWRCTRGLDPDRTALFTVSEWEPDVPDLGDAAPSPWDQRIRCYQGRASSGGMLRRMPNSVCCHIAIAAKLRGPNAHYVGGGGALALVLELAAAALDRGEAEAAVVVAFDPVDDHPGGASTETAGPVGVAVACVLAADPTAIGVEPDVGGHTGPVPLPSDPVTPDATAAGGLGAWLDHVRGAA